jgi:hypothetical protein
MSLNISGLEHYQAHQQVHQAADKAASGVGAAKSTSESTPSPEDDSVFVSDTVAVLEWVAAQAPDMMSAQATEPANLGRLTGHLLQYNLISLQDAGRLMRLSGPDSEQPLLERIHSNSTESGHYHERQSWQKLSRIVSNVHAAQ